MIDTLLIAGFGVFLWSAAMAERKDPVEYWLPPMVGAVTILAYAGLADVATVMAAKP
jgi:hypothetical protein